ncbi:MAG: hypothetical protein ACE5LB_17195 [Acidiferrobacterales bacterium]
MGRSSFIISLVAVFSLVPFAPVSNAAQQTPKIKKCQDAQGKWHYGDHAAAECERSKVIEITGKGVKTREIKAPPTDAELQKRERQQAEQQAARKRAEEQARRDEQLLDTYGHEQDIIYIRDRKLAQIEHTITATNGTVKPLRAALGRMQAEAAKSSGKGREVPNELAIQIRKTEAQIARHEAFIAEKGREQDAISQQAEADLLRYRELKSQQAVRDAGKSKPR